MSQTTQQLRQGSDIIKQAIAIAEETRDVGAGSLQTLQGQRQQMVAGQTRVRAINEDVTRADNLMRIMARRIKTNRMLTVIIIIILLAGIGITIWLAFF
jgi:hypothetical protein